MVVRVEDTFQYYRIVDNYYYELVEVSDLFMLNGQAHQIFSASVLPQYWL